MKRKVLSLALALCLLLSVTAVFTPVFAEAAVGDGVAWDIQYTGGVMNISWPAVAGATSYEVARAGARLGTYTVREASNTTRTFTDTSPNAEKYENYYRITPNVGAAFYISLEGKIFGPNCYFYDPKYNTNEQAAYDINTRGADYPRQEMGRQREALFFKPGTYADSHVANSRISCGFYVSIYGLGRLPTDTTIGCVTCMPNGSYMTGGHTMNANGDNATQTFWRSIENVNVTYSGTVPTSANDTLWWAVSQAAPARRLQASAAVFSWEGGWASGGYLSDSRMTGSHGSGPQQQFYYRNNWAANAPGGFTNWNFVYEGCTGAAAKADSGESYATGKTTTYDTVQAYPGTQSLIREKPFIYLDGGEYKVFVPGWRTDASGPSWDQTTSNMGVGVSIPLLSSDIYIAYPSNTSDQINEALFEGKNVVLTPGIYELAEPLVVSQPDTFVLGLGYATLVPAQGNQWGAMTVADVEGVIISGIMFDAWYSSVYLMRVGEEGYSEENNSANPIIMHDVFFRVGGFANQACQVDVALQINANYTILDHTWIWRADHGAGWTGWDVAKSDYGLFVSGDHVTIHGLFNEHFQKYTTYWEGEYGAVYFQQNETPYDVNNAKGHTPIPPPTVYRSHNGTQDGYSQLKVANKVNHFFGAGLGAYACFTQLGGGPNVFIENAYEVPLKADVKLYHIQNINISSNASTFRHMVNGIGPGATGASSVYMVRYPVVASPLSDPANGAQTSDEAISPPSYDDRGIGYPPWFEATLEGPSASFKLTNLTKESARMELGADFLATLFTGTDNNYGYYVPDSISVTMNGVPLTAGQYTYTPSADRLSADLKINGSLISTANYDADGRVVFTITAAADADYSTITYALDNLTASDNTYGSKLYNGKSFSAMLTAADGYILPAGIAVTGAAYNYVVSADKKSATVTITAISGDVNITAAGVANFANVTYDLTGVVKMGGAPDRVDFGSAAGIPLQVSGGAFTMPVAVTVTMGGATLTPNVDYTYARELNFMSGIIIVKKVTGDVKVTVAATGTAGLPDPGSDIYLVSARTGKIVRVGAVPATDTMVADVNTVFPIPSTSIFRTQANGVSTLLRYNNNSVTLEGGTYGGAAVRPRTPGVEAYGSGWSSTVLEVQDDGTIKIYRMGTNGDQAGIAGQGYTLWVDVLANGNLATAPMVGPGVIGVGDTGKFAWFLSTQQILVPVNKADLLSALNVYNGLVPAQYVNWAAVGITAFATAGQGVYDDDGASQATVDDAAASLWDAIKALILDGGTDIYAISLSQTGAYTFPAATVGYAAQAPLSVQVNNVGNQPTGALTASVNNTNFVVTGGSIADIAVGGNAGFSVTPAAGLAVGTYTATVTVSGGNGITASFNVSFKVDAVVEPTYGISLSRTGTYTFPDAAVGYGAQTAVSVQVNNTGNQPTGALAASVDSANFTVTGGAIAGIAVGANASFTVAPVNGLAIGTYTATVTVGPATGNSNPITPQSFNVSFTVTAAPPVGIVNANRGTTTPVTAMASNWNPNPADLPNPNPNEVAEHAAAAAGMFGYGPAAAIDNMKAANGGEKSRWGTRGWNASNLLATYEDYEWIDLTLPRKYVVSSMQVLWALGYPEFFKVQYWNGADWKDVTVTSNTGGTANTNVGTSVWNLGDVDEFIDVNWAGAKAANHYFDSTQFTVKDGDVVINGWKGSNGGATTTDATRQGNSGNMASAVAAEITQKVAFEPVTTDKLRIQMLKRGFPGAGTNTPLGEGYGIWDLEYFGIVAPDVPEIDYTALETQITRFNGLTEGDWTAASWAVALAAKNAGQSLVGNATTQAEVDAAALTLKNAIDDLVAYVAPIDYTALEAQITRFNGLTETEWTAASWAIALAAKNAGQSLVGNATTQAEVDAAALTLKNAIDNLVAYVAPGEYYLGLLAYQDPAFTLKVGQKMILGLKTNVDYSDLVFTYSSTYLKIDQATGMVTGVRSGVAVITITTKVDPSLKLTLIAQIG